MVWITGIFLKHCQNVQQNDKMCKHMLWHCFEKCGCAWVLLTLTLKLCHYSGSNMEGNTNTTTYFHMHTDGAVNTRGVLFVSLNNMCSSSPSTHRLGLCICTPRYCLQSKTNILFHEFWCACLCVWECVPCLGNREGIKRKVLNMDTSSQGKYHSL